MTNDLAVTTFKERLRLTVELSGMNARALSKRAGFKSPTHISALLASKGDPNPTRKTLEKLAEAAGVPLEWLASGKGDAPTLATPRFDGADNDQEPIASPAPPPVSRTVTVDFARNNLVNAAYDPREHVPTDMVPVLEALEVGAPLLKASADPTAYVRRLLDIVAKARKRGERVTGDELPTLAAIEMSGTLDRAAALAKAEAMAEAHSWMRANGIEPPPPGRGLHPALVALAEAPEAPGGAVPASELFRGKP